MINDIARGLVSLGKAPGKPSKGQNSAFPSPTLLTRA